MCTWPLPPCPRSPQPREDKGRGGEDLSTSCRQDLGRGRHNPPRAEDQAPGQEPAGAQEQQVRGRLSCQRPSTGQHPAHRPL